mgnify:CR=1 FL=1
MIKKVLSFLLILAYVISVVPAYANSDITVVLDGKILSFEQNPFIENGRTLVPMRAIFEALGASVSWDGETKTVTSQKENTTVKVTIDQAEMEVNGEKKVLDVPAKIVNDRTFVPLRAVSEAFGAKVDYVAESKVILISSTGTTGYPKDPYSGKYFRIVHTKTQKSLTVANGALGDGARITIDTTKDEDIQLWSLETQDKDYFTVINKKSKRAIDIPGFNMEPGAWVTQYGTNYGDNQVFKFIKLDDGNYYLQCRHSGLYVTVKEDGYLYQEEFTGDDSQIFTVILIETEDKE